MRALAFVLMVPTAQALAAAQAAIELLPEAGVPAGSVVLGQVARVHASDLDLMRKLVHLPVGRAPAHGDVSVLQREALAQWVRQRTGMRAEALAWSGPQESRVLGVAALVAGEEIARVAVDAARAQLAASGRTGDVHARLLPRDVPLPGGEVRLEVRGPNHASWSRRLVVWVDVWAGGWFVRTVPVGLETGTGASASAVAAAGMPLSSAAGPFGPTPPAREPLAVARGDGALMRSTEGAILLESRVEVLQDGRPGQKVRVRQQGANGPVLARVVGRGQLELAP